MFTRFGRLVRLALVALLAMVMLGGLSSAATAADDDPSPLPTLTGEGEAKSTAERATECLGGMTGSPAGLAECGSVAKKAKDPSLFVGCTAAKVQTPECIKAKKEGAEAIAKAGKKVAGAVKSSIDFFKDPLGYVAGKMQEGASGLTNDVLPVLVEATSPDFSAKWWIDAYRVSFAVALAVWGLMLLRVFVDMTMRRVGPEDAAAALTEKSPLVLVGAMFGPAIGGAVMKLFNELTNGIIKWGFGDTFQSMGDAVKALDKIVRAASPGAISGGSFIAIVVYTLFIIGLLLVLATLIVAMITMYMAGAVFPIGWAWMTHPETQDRAMKVVRVFLGLLCAKPLVFFLLVVAMKMTASGIFGVDAPKDQEGVEVLIAMFACAAAMLMVAFSPFMMPKMAQVGPTEGGASPALRGRGGSSRGGAGATSPTNGQLAQIAGKGGGSAAGGKAAAAGGLAGMATAGATMLAAKAGGKIKDAGKAGSPEGQGSPDQSGGGQNPDTNGGLTGASENPNGQEQGSSPNQSTSPQPVSSDPAGDGENTLSQQAHGQGTNSHQPVGDSPGDAAPGGGQEPAEQSRLQDAAGSTSGADGNGGGDSDADEDRRSRLAGIGAMSGGGAKSALRGLQKAGATGSSLTDALEEQVDSQIQHQYKGPRAR